MEDFLLGFYEAFVPPLQKEFQSDGHYYRVLYSSDCQYQLFKVFHLENFTVEKVDGPWIQFRFFMWPLIKINFFHIYL